MMTQENTQTTYIYLLSAGQHQKVGQAKNIATRIKNLQCGNPFPIRLLARWSIPRGQAATIEASCFAQFKDFSEHDISGVRRPSEWYKAEAPIFAFLKKRLGQPQIEGANMTKVERQMAVCYAVLS